MSSAPLGDGWHSSKALKCLMQLMEESMLSFYLSNTFNFGSLLYRHVMVNNFEFIHKFRQLKQGSMHTETSSWIQYLAQNMILHWKMIQNRINKVCISAFNWKTVLLRICSCLIYLWCTKEVWLFRGLKTHEIPTVSHFYSNVMASKPTQTTLVTFVSESLKRLELHDVQLFQQQRIIHALTTLLVLLKVGVREPAASILHPGPQNNDVTPRRLM